jgi:molybdopterin molybdotransferase
MAEDVMSRFSVPSFRKSTVDGYAVRSEDVRVASRRAPVSLRKVAVVHAGTVSRKRVSEGLCVGVATGAVLPRGADAVVMAERAEVDGDMVLFRAPVRHGANVSEEGEDLSAGMRIVVKGESLTPGRIGALASVGKRTVRVYSKPLVAVVPTGDEIAELGKNLRKGQVYNVNGYTLPSVVEANGGIARPVGPVRDDVESLERALSANSDCDMVVFSGGSSVGEKDFVADLIERNGRMLFRGVALRPGRSTMLGEVGGRLVWGLPGPPAASLSGACVLMVPVLRTLARLPSRNDAFVDAKMAKKMVFDAGLTRFVAVSLDRGVARPLSSELGPVAGIARADGYVIVRADAKAVVKGERVRVHPF